MELHGRNLLGRETSASSRDLFQASNPATGARLDPPYHEAAPGEIDRAMDLAASAFAPYRARPAAERADFLERIAEEILALGDVLIDRAHRETGLPAARLTGERARTAGQLRMFAALIREGSWVEARIDRAQPARQPLPKPDVRSLLIPIGPVAVFGASNFPLAFSVAGGDTASALAAGCPVVIKAHPAHPGTSELAGRAILAAAEKHGLPEGVFSLVHGRKNETGLGLVRHAAARAVAFTGSLRGGRALHDAAAARPVPIPVHAEMGSANPVFVLPGALRERAEEFAAGLHASVTLGVGQFCTNPGLILGLAGDGLDRFAARFRELIGKTAAGTMLHAGIREAYEGGARRLRDTPGVAVLAESEAAADPARTEARARAFSTRAAVFLARRELAEEVFGPSTLIVRCESAGELEAIARGLDGHLTATIHGTADDLREHRGLVAIIEEKVGRLLWNGFPTGVEVCPAVHHGGPYPATTDPRFTSVGTAAIRRFARPVCYQNWPEEALPLELRTRNERGIWRLVDGELTRGDL
jgi:NADP-dependent aldehyde dehydrogenase